MMKYTLLVAIVALAAMPVLAQSKTTKKASSAAHPNTTAPTKVTGEPKKTPSGLEYWDIKVGTGPTAEKGHMVTVNYTGWLTNGKKFDSSVDAGKPFDFTLGAGAVIKGWDEGVADSAATCVWRARLSGCDPTKLDPDLRCGAAGSEVILITKAQSRGGTSPLQIGNFRFQIRSGVGNAAPINLQS